MPTYKGSDSVAPPFDPKDPDDVDNFTYSFVAELGAGVTISTKTVTADAGITVDDDIFALSNQGVQVTLSGGTAGQDYRVAVKITASNGRVLEKTGIVPVRHR